MSSVINQKHVFALYADTIIKKGISVGSIITSDDEQLIHRMVRVLRLNKGEQCILFDRAQHCLVTLVSITKKTIQVCVDSSSANVRYTPSITVLLPVLKRDDLDEAVYGLVETGVNTIQLVETHRQWGGQRERERLERVIIAAGEQSKQYDIPVLFDPVTLADAIQTIPKNALRIFFDPSGASILTLLQQSANRASNPIDTIVFSFGPEADYATEQKELLKRNDFFFYRLTPTVLRSRQVASLGSGILRSVF